MSKLESMLDACIEANASDVHLTFGLPLNLRVHGRITGVGDKPLSDKDLEGIVEELTTEDQRADLRISQNLEFGYPYKDGTRFRVSIYQQQGHPAIVMRRISETILTMEDIGLPSVIKSLLEKSNGLVLVAGPTGSGKSTTLASMIDYVNSNDDRHIITIEDPVEYVHPHKKSIVNQRELGVDTPSFSQALVESLRQDPDVILVGEMRDLQTIRTALEAAETGHLVLSTVHTFGAARSLDRIIDVFPPNHQNQIRTQLSLNLAAVISQALIPKVDGTGRVAAFEIMLMTPAIQNLLRKGETFNIQNEIQTGTQYGMVSLQNSLISMVDQGIISREDALFHSIDREEMAKRLGIPPI